MYFLSCEEIKTFFIIIIIIIIRNMKLKGKTTKDLGLCEANNIYISESLTASNRELFNEALKVKKDLNYKFIWSSNG